MSTTDLKRGANTRHFLALCELIDGTNFRRSPYRGILTKVADRLGITPSGVHVLIKKRRQVKAMSQVAKEIKRVDDRIQDLLDEVVN